MSEIEISIGVMLIVYTILLLVIAAASKEWLRYEQRKTEEKEIESEEKHREA